MYSDIGEQQARNRYVKSFPYKRIRDVKNKSFPVHQSFFMLNITEILLLQIEVNNRYVRSFQLLWWLNFNQKSLSLWWGMKGFSHWSLTEFQCWQFGFPFFGGGGGMQHSMGAWSAWLVRSNHKDLRVKRKKLYFMLVPQPKSFWSFIQNGRTTRF